MLTTLELEDQLAVLATATELYTCADWLFLLHTSASILLSKLLSAYEIIIGLFQPLATKDVGLFII